MIYFIVLNDFSQINYEKYIEVFVTPLIESMKKPGSTIDLEICTDDISLNINTSIPLGLLINEIITNSLKHGFTNNSQGKIYVRIKAEEYPKFTLEIGDNGVGLPDSVDLEINDPDTLGLLLISSLVEQLQGDIECNTKEAGTHYIVYFEELTMTMPIGE